MVFIAVDPLSRVTSISRKVICGSSPTSLGTAATFLSLTTVCVRPARGLWFKLASHYEFPESLSYIFHVLITKLEAFFYVDCFWECVYKKGIRGAQVMLCIWWEQLGVVYYELFKPSETITWDQYRMKLMLLSRALEGGTVTVLRETRESYPPAWQYLATCHKTRQDILGNLTHSPYSPDIAPFDYHLFRSMEHGLTHQHFRFYKEVKKWIDSWIASKGASFFWEVCENCQ